MFEHLLRLRLSLGTGTKRSRLLQAMTRRERLPGTASVFMSGTMQTRNELGVFD